MKTISLRTLVREPLKVKRITQTGKPVRVTDNGRPLWVVHPAVANDGPDQRRREIEADLTEVLRQPKPRVPLSKIVLESRR